MWTAYFKCQCRSSQSLPSLWEFTEPSAGPERLIFCSECKMLIHAAGNPELGERAVVLSSLSLSLYISRSLSNSVTDCIMIVHVRSLCLIQILFTCRLSLTRSTPQSLWPLACLMKRSPLGPSRSTSTKIHIIYWAYPYSTPVNGSTFGRGKRGPGIQALVVKSH